MNIKNIINILKNYRWQSFLLKSYVVIFCIMSIPLGIFTVIISNNYRSNMLSNIKMLTNSSDSTLTYYIDSEFKKIDDFYLNLKNSDTYSSDFSYMLQCDDLGTDWEAESTRNIYRYIGDFISNNNFIKSIYVYGSKSGYVYSSGHVSGNYLNDFQDKEIIIKATSQNGFTARRKNINHNNYDFISVHKKLTYADNDLGAMVFNIDVTKLFEAMHESDMTLENWFVADNNGYILYSSSNDVYIGRKTEYYDFLKADALNAENIRSDNTVTTSVKSNINDISYIFVNKYDTYIQSRRMYLFSVSLIALLMIALGLVISAILTIFFYKYISTIVDMLQPYTTLYDVQENSAHTTKEMQIITNSILAVTSQNKDLREELSNRLASLKKAQSSMLQMQINPHFLHNTLNTINAIVISEFKGDTVVSDMITNLSDILRYSLNTAEYLVRLDTEIMYLNTYIEIQKTKYNNKFSVEYHIDDNVKNYKVLKLSLQPLVENAIIHGVIPKNQHGEIKVSAYSTGNLLKLIIEDDGVGINAHELYKINKKINNDVFLLDKSLGIENTAKRIRLIFGDEYGLKIQTSDTGTSIVLTIPQIM